MNRPPPHVLIVDDDTDILEALRELLQTHGVPVQTVPSAFAALSTLARDPVPGLVLLDLRMPGMSGWQLFEWMQREPTTAGIPVVIISGERQDRGAAQARGVKDVLQKPIDLGAMLALVDQYCGTAA